MLSFSCIGENIFNNIFIYPLKIAYLYKFILIISTTIHITSIFGIKFVPHFHLMPLCVLIFHLNLQLWSWCLYSSYFCFHFENLFCVNANLGHIMVYYLILPHIFSNRYFGELNIHHYNIFNYIIINEKIEESLHNLPSK